VVGKEDFEEEKLIENLRKIMVKKVIF